MSRDVIIYRRTKIIHNPTLQTCEYFNQNKFMYHGNQSDTDEIASCEQNGNNPAMGALQLNVLPAPLYFAENCEFYLGFSNSWSRIWRVIKSSNVHAEVAYLNARELFKFTPAVVEI